MEAENRKGKCTNIGVCEKANSEEVQVITDPFAELICSNPLCGLPLEEIKEGKTKKKGNFPVKKIINIGVPILVIGLIIWGGIALFSGKSEQNEKSKSDLLSKINNMDNSETPVNTNQPSTTENSTTENTPATETTKNTTPEKKSDPYSLTANSLEEYFQKIADSSIPYNKKDNLKREIISKYFADEKTMVVEIGANNTEVGHTEIKDYVEELSQQYYKIKIINKETNSGQKITKLFIKEL
jgi:hypothetical protein